MDFKIVKPPKPLYFPGFVNQLQFQESVEERYLKQIVKSFNNGTNQIYLLCEVGGGVTIIYGLIALSDTTFQDASTLSIDYLLTSQPYRGEVIQGLGDQKVSEYLMDFTVQQAVSEQKKYILLEPAHDNLIKFYRRFGFEEIKAKTRVWMFKPIL